VQQGHEAITVEVNVSERAQLQRVADAAIA
jgi:hypothetical protein